MKIERVDIVVHGARPEAVDLAGSLEVLLRERGVEVGEEDPDVVLSLGGDGTMLRAAQRAHRADAPLLGVNFGILGYLTEVEPQDAGAAIERLLDGSFTIEERMMLGCEGLAGADVSWVGLNEVLVERSSHRRMVRLSVRVERERLATFNGDGVIVATPTGSTAYALSAGGPIVSPLARCLVVVPVNPHMMFSRPFVLNPDATVEIRVEGDGGERSAALSLDGMLGTDLDVRSALRVSRHPRPLRLVRLSGPGFIERLRVKLHLPG